MLFRSQSVHPIGFIERVILKNLYFLRGQTEASESEYVKKEFHTLRNRYLVAIKDFVYQYVEVAFAFIASVQRVFLLDLVYIFLTWLVVQMKERTTHFVTTKSKPQTELSISLNEVYQQSLSKFN